jgi:hypothetical protein
MLGGHQNQENREGDQIEVAERKREEFMEAMRIIRGNKRGKYRFGKYQAAKYTVLGRYAVNTIRMRMIDHPPSILHPVRPLRFIPLRIVFRTPQNPFNRHRISTLKSSTSLMVCGD